MADWSMLPCDILVEIALKLDELGDFIYFSAVCHKWNEASSLIKFEGNNAKTMMPWLLLAENTNENPECVRKIYSPSNNRCYQLKLPYTFGARCWGTSHGWIVMQTYDHQVHLFNPLTKVRITSLPSLLSLPHLEQPVDVEEDEWFVKFLVHRIVVLKMPSDDDELMKNLVVGGDLVVAVMYGVWKNLALAHLGDQAWTYIDWCVDAVGCWGEHMYILRGNDCIRYCNIKGISDFKDLKIVDYAPFPDLTLLDSPWGHDKLYLLNMGGNLLVVHRSLEEIYKEEYDPPRYHWCTICFRIYKVDPKSKNWVKVNDIGNSSIFVGTHSAFSMLMLTANNYKANSVYFTDDEVKFGNYSGFGWPVDMGVYNMDSGDVTKFYEGDDMHSIFCPPLFFVPKC